MTPADAANGAFELLGSLLTWMSVRRVWKDRGYAGIYLPAVIFFTSWGIWNLYYYPHLGQWASFGGGCSLVVANGCWIAGMLRYGRLKR